MAEAPKRPSRKLDLSCWTPKWQREQRAPYIFTVCLPASGPVALRLRSEQSRAVYDDCSAHYHRQAACITGVNEVCNAIMVTVTTTMTITVNITITTVAGLLLLLVNTVIRHKLEGVRRHVLQHCDCFCDGNADPHCCRRNRRRSHGAARGR